MRIWHTETKKRQPEEKPDILFTWRLTIAARANEKGLLVDDIDVLLVEALNIFLENVELLLATLFPPDFALRVQNDLVRQRLIHLVHRLPLLLECAQELYEENMGKTRDAT
jgi:hypothetical protein